VDANGHLNGNEGTTMRTPMMGMGKTMKTPVPTSTAVSNCSQGGFGVLMADHNVGEGGKRGMYNARE